MCAPIVQVSHLMNIHEVEGSDDILIRAGRSYAVPVNMNVPDTVLTWQFSTQPKVRHCAKIFSSCRFHYE